ncbi:MAG: hypothetical protein ABIA75_03330 [Candidatus Neomarinimicrobiota bacterium]
MKRWILLTVFAVTILAAQPEPAAQAVADSVKARLAEISDYSVRIKLAVQMPQLRMPRKIIDLHYKRPDKLKIEVDGFAVVPRQGIEIGGILDSLQNLSLAGAEPLDQYSCWLLRGERRERNLAMTTTIWVDRNDWVVRQVRSFVDTVNVASINIDYTLIDERYLMPARTEVNFQTTPEMVSDLGHFDPDRRGPSIEQRVDLSAKNGSVIMEFSRYRINQGLKDSLFDE